MRIQEPSLIQIQGLNQSAQGQPVHKNRFASQNRMAGSQPVWQQPKLQDMQANFNPQLEPATGISSGVPADKQMGFADLLDVINPLQHIPLVSTLYRKVTGDVIGPAAQFIGGALFGGPIGAASAMADAAIRDRTGKGFTDNMTALVTDSDQAFKQETDMDLASSADFGAIMPAAGRHYTFGAVPRTAGLMPIWGAPVQTASASKPVKALSLDTDFALMLQRLEA